LPVSSISKETEGGKIEYEVETTYKGKPRSDSFNCKGLLLEIEDSVDRDSIPAAAKATPEKKAAGGTIKEVEKLASGEKVFYEADMIASIGKKTAVSDTENGVVKSVEDGDEDKD